MSDVIEKVAKAIHATILGKGDDWEDVYVTNQYPLVKAEMIKMAKAAIAALADEFEDIIDLLETLIDHSSEYADIPEITHFSHDNLVTMHTNLTALKGANHA